jgi:hypothetical protein
MPLDTKTIKKIEKSLHGISIPTSLKNQDPFDFKLLGSGETRPPSYIIKILLEALFERPLHRGMEKSEWEEVISYKNKIWLISDWKHYAWRISSSKGSLNEAKELAKRLSSSGKIIDTFIRKLAKDVIKKEKYSLNNQFREYRSIYEYYRGLLEDLIAKADPDRIVGKPGKKRTELVNSHFQSKRHAEYTLISTTIFFFSLTEIIFDAYFSLSDRRNLSFIDFRKLDWAERFKFIFETPFNENVNKIYQHLIKIRKFYRNIPVHASPEFLLSIEIDNIGLIPMSFEDLDAPRLSYGFKFDIEDTKGILTTFDETISLLKNSKATWFAYTYAESELSFHINDEFSEELKGHMKTKRGFKKEIDRRVTLYYAMINGEI